ncbi:MAG: valine--tRNA ligase [Verrucomicrobiales bacterium]|nr:valine--tRNA ligase [Verrucomicrobiales bacterium]
MEISKAYEPQSVEARWYSFWLEQQCFAADPARVSATRPAYSIVIPPPNVTGVLTMGHVLNNTIQDILARKARMDGKEVLWLPGTDHAGIATQNVVEKTLKKAGEIKHRDDLGREKLVARIWEWKETYGGIILKQLRALGASCDWNRTRFTMDPDYSRCVQKVFVDLYKKGLIYRGKRMVNWCPASLTALSDEEVIMKEQKGFLYHFRVEVVEQPGTFLTIATTRPETIPADTAVAVNPKDPRYTHLIGKHVYRALPLDQPKEQRVIPIIADDHVTFDFGTGVLKVTPAHDKADYEIGVRHQLPVIDVLTPDGKMTPEAGADLAGLDRFAARKKSAEILEAAGALEKAEPYVNNVGFSERADVPIEPRLSEQWFLKYPSVEASKACVAQPGDATAGPMCFFPDRWAKVYDHWMGGIQDWCISRQLWWGHRIPVWRKSTVTVAKADPKNPIAISQFLATFSEPASLETSLSGFAEHITSIRCLPESECWEAVTFSDEEAKKLEEHGFTQDPDVLDTWFSSWLWPFATMGWTGDPETDAKNPTLKAFYPTTDLVTGPDIIFFWVARMIMAGYEWMGDLPFRNVYFTGIIRDKQGRKMSKSLGNSPDPLDLIAKYGADALRFGVMRAAPLGQDVLFDEQSVELGRNFCNKLWNSCRFRQMQGGATEGEINPALLTSDDRWILLRLDQAIREVTQAFTDYKFSDATATLYRFFWSEYCDWYIEASKAVFHGADEALKANKLAVIDFVIGNLLRLFHPFLPFITEELWHGLGFNADLPDNQGGRTIQFAPWPKAFDDDEKAFFRLDETADAVAQAKYDLVTLGRGLRRDCKIDPAKKVKFVLRPAGDLPAAEADVLKILLNAESLVLDRAFTPPKGTPMAANSLGELFLPLEGLVDVEAERTRLTKELDKIRQEIGKVEAKLANPAFTQKVPAAVLAEHQQRLVDWQAKERQVSLALENLGS